MKKALFSFLIILIISCSHNKNLAQSKPVSANDSLLQYINKSKSDTEIANPKMKQLQQENDLVISFVSLNYAWARRGSFYVITQKGKLWNLYRYDTKLPLSADDNAVDITPLETDAKEAEKIKALCIKAKLWQTGGDNGENFCRGKKDCSISDAESWAISIATKTNVHTTAYYAPEFFEDCCPGNSYRKQFIVIAKAIMKLTGNNNSGGEEK